DRCPTTAVAWLRAELPFRLTKAQALPAPGPERVTRRTRPTTRSFADSSASSEQRNARASRRSSHRSVHADARPGCEVGGPVYLTGGATAVLYGWRESTIDVDIKVVPDNDELRNEAR